MLENIVNRTRPNKLQPIKIQKKIQNNEFDCDQKHLMRILRYENYDTVKLEQQNKQYYIETDNNFIQDITNIAKIRQNILMGLINYKKQYNNLTNQQCNQIDYKARLHSDANIINSNTKLSYSSITQQLQCKCGCQKTKGQLISLCTHENNLNVLGSGVLLLFMFKKAIFIVLIIIMLIYAIFALVTNFLGGNIEINSECDWYCFFIRGSSDENKLNPELYSIIQWWLGLIICLIWIISLRFIKYYGRCKNSIIDKKLTSSSDYAIKIGNLPYGEYEQKQLLEYFQKLWQKIKQQQQQQFIHQKQNNNNNENEKQDNIMNSYRNCFEMKSIQIIYNMKFSRMMIDKIFQQATYVESLILQNKQNENKKNKIKNLKKYNQSKNILIQTYELLSDLRKKFLNDGNFRKKISTTCCLIEFKNQQSKNLLLKYFGKQKISLLKQIQSKIKNFISPENRNIIFKGNILRIQRAPQPSDILWINCQKKYSLTRKMLIFIITLFIVCVSFGILSLLDWIQTNQGANFTTILNFLMSIALLIVNKFLWWSLFYLLELEYNHTLTQKIVSQMNKTLLASSINIIILPIISNYIIRRNMFGTAGLAGIVVNYHLTIIGPGLITKLIDPGYTLIRIALNIKLIRNIIIRFLCSYATDIKANQGVYEVNIFYQGSYFDIAQSYVYLMGTIYHAAFFCQLQPVILIIVCGLIILFYWVNKIKLLRMSKIPEITQILVFETAISQASLVPVFYGIGSIILSFIETQYYPNRPFNFIASLIIIIIGLIGFFNPGDIFNLIIIKFIQCCNCLSANKIIQDQSNLQQQQQRQNYSKIQLQNNNNNNSNNNNNNHCSSSNQTLQRMDNYYRQSNALYLLGFQWILTGNDQNQNIIHQLQNYCQSYFPNYNSNIKNIAFQMLRQTKQIHHYNVEKLSIIPNQNFIYHQNQRQQQQQQ